MTSSTLEETLTTSGVYSTATFDLNPSSNVYSRADSTDFSLESMEVLAQGIDKLLRTKTLRITISSKPA